MSKLLKIVPALLLGLFYLGSPSLAAGQKPPTIGTLDINSQETGDGAGCFFYTEEEAGRSYVFVDRDRLGWIRVNGAILTLEPTARSNRWPWVKGETKNKQYSSETMQADLNVEVISDCGENLEACEVVYAGTLNLAFKGQDLVMDVKGHCAH